MKSTVQLKRWRVSTVLISVVRQTHSKDGGIIMGLKQWLSRLLEPAEIGGGNAPRDTNAVPERLNALGIQRFREVEPGVPIKQPVTYEECVRLYNAGKSDVLVDMNVGHKAAATKLTNTRLETWDQVSSVCLIVLRLAPFDRTTQRLRAAFPAVIGGGSIWNAVYLSCVLILSTVGRKAASEPLSGDPAGAVAIVSELLNVPDSRVKSVGTFLLRAAGPAGVAATPSLIGLLTDSDPLLASNAAAALAAVDLDEFKLHADVARSVMEKAKEAVQRGARDDLEA